MTIRARPKRKRSSSEIAASQVSYLRRQAWYEEVVEFYRQGKSIAAIARELHMSPITVRKFVYAGAFPERSAHKRRQNYLLMSYLPYLQQRVAEGCENASELWKEICNLGFTQGYKVVNFWLREYLGKPGRSSTEEEKAKHLCLLYLRFGLPDRWRQPEWAIARIGQDRRLSFDGFVHSLYRRLEAHASTIHDFVEQLYDDSIIRQHQLVADSKQPDNTYRFQRERNQLIFYRFDNSLGFMSSRFDALSTTLHELGLCGELTEPMHKLTPNGIKFLTEGDIK